ncbi:MAG: hypothetical protein V3V72_13430 [Ignavibacteriaceae bacterium]
MKYNYINSEPGLWTVGFYNPDGKWKPESDHNIREEAAKRIAWLNGSGENPMNVKMHEALKGLWKIRDLLCYPLDVPFEHIEEAKAVSEALSAIEYILIDLES